MHQESAVVDRIARAVGLADGFDLWVPRPPETVVERLGRLTGEAPGAYAGRVDGRRFSLRRRAWRNGYQPLTRGVCTAAGDGTRIEVWQRPTALALAGLLGWWALALVVAVAVARGVVEGGTSPAVGLLPAGMVAAGWLGAILGFRSGAEADREALRAAA